MKELLFLSTFLLLITLLHCTITLAKSPPPAPSPAQSPAPSVKRIPTNVTGILSKDQDGIFTMFIRLLKKTQVGEQINTQINSGTQGMTLFAPPDTAFDTLKSSIFNSLTDKQKQELVQFHILLTYIALAEFQTLSNPLHTESGDAYKGRFPLIVTTAGTKVNISTGVTDASIVKTIYNDNTQFVIYEVDKVLLPMDMFAPPAPVITASAPEKPPPAASDISDSSGLPSHAVVSFAIAVIVSFSL